MLWLSNGLVYDSKIEHYPTSEINEVIGYTAQLSKELDQIKKPDSLFRKEKSGLVPEHLENAISIDDFERIRHFKNLRSLSD